MSRQYGGSLRELFLICRSLWLRRFSSWSDFDASSAAAGERFRPDERLDPRTCLTCDLVLLWVMKHDTPADCIAELRNQNAILDMRLASISGAMLRGRPKMRDAAE